MWCRGPSAFSSRELREFAAQWLPTYMVPQAILLLEKMPPGPAARSIAGAPAARRSPGHGAPELCRPGTPTQATLAEIWSELLKRDKLGFTTTSLNAGALALATRLVSRIRRAFDVELPLRAVFEGQPLPP